MTAASTPILLAGDWTPGAGPALRIEDPVDGSLVGTVNEASLDQVDAAVRAGARAVDESGWHRRPPHRRADVLYQAARLIVERAETLADLQTAENGKTLKESRGQATAAAGIVRYFAAVCETMEGAVPPPRGDYLAVTTHEPFGVVAAMTPWNSPLTMGAQKLAPALAAGNAVVLKPSELTTLVSLELARAFADAGLPAGLLSVLPGGRGVGEALVTHPGVGMVSFTGGTATGRAIAAAAAPRFLPVVLELGGKSPNVVFADADLDAAARGVASAIFGSGGQSCVAGSRLFVQRPVYDQVVQRVVAAGAALRVGPARDPNSDIGPMASFAQRERVEGYVDLARGEGGRVLLGGARPDDPALAGGAYYLPTVIDGLDHESRVCQEEIFGGVLVALPFDGEDDLVALADDTVYGLACGLWTRDLAKAWRVARRVKAGTVWINTYKELSIASPFGGFKDSGLGREKGLQGLRAYQQTKSIYLGGLEG
ncbi:MAG: aldehyde dehydrogenase family protein [Hyphomicrobiales bacterium]|nr:aldehyde dehydrogenase family protein [Hyphomicrobiales bacterium]